LLYITPFILIRVSEPYVQEILKEIICKKRSKMKKKFAEQSLDSFMNSAMNIEFVYIILKGVKNYMDLANDQDQGLESKRSFMYKRDKSGQNHISIDSFKLEDASKWDVRTTSVEEKPDPEAEKLRRLSMFSEKE
jgi:hypothetical protein